VCVYPSTLADQVLRPIYNTPQQSFSISISSVCVSFYISRSSAGAAVCANGNLEQPSGGVPLCLEQSAATQPCRVLCPGEYALCSVPLCPGEYALCSVPLCLEQSAATQPCRVLCPGEYALCVPLSALIRSWFQAKPATLLIPIGLFPLMVDDFYGTQYQSGSFSLVSVGSGFHRAPAQFFFSGAL
jgi:hypothetical protein